MPVDNWEDSSGHFIAETWRGQVLADELDDIFAIENPGLYIATHIPETKIETIPDEEPLRYKLLGLCLGSTALALATNYCIYSPLVDAFKNLHF